jgi:hypothetical protein
MTATKNRAVPRRGEKPQGSEDSALRYRSPVLQEMLFARTFLCACGKYVCEKPFLVNGVLTDGWIGVCGLVLTFWERSRRLVYAMRRPHPSN